jgi:hypothetical protein
MNTVSMNTAARCLKIAILEDNADRTVAMRAALADKLYMYEPHFLPTAPMMLAWLERHLEETIAISLDHDLELPLSAIDRTDPGDGRLVAKALAVHAPICPVIIHTTNVVCGDSMEATLAEGGWRTFRVTPCDDLHWIRATWLPLMREVLFHAATMESVPASQLV